MTNLTLPNESLSGFSIHFMKVCGFTFVRNAIKYDYPICEAISSLLPVCDQVVVSVGNSDDGTLELIKSIPSDKIKIIETIWDDSLRVGGKVLAVETDKAFDAISEEYDWAFYLQADEVFHEKYIPIVRDAMLQYKNDKRVEGLLFNYTHFYGNYKYIGDSRSWYRNEIRIIRNDKQIRSYRDAQGFRKNGEKLKVKAIDAYIYHYGWVKNPYNMHKKAVALDYLFHDNQSPYEEQQKKLQKEDLFDYSKINSLSLFKETHPEVMQKRIGLQDWDFEFDITKKKLSFKHRVLYIIEKLTGKRLFEYKNYIKI